MERLKNNALVIEIFRVVVVILASAFYSLTVVIFLEPAGLIATGLTAISQIINRLLISAGVHNPFFTSIGLYTLLLNIPILIYGWKGVSHRFIIYSILSIITQFIFLAGWIDGQYILTEIIGIANPSEVVLFLAIIAGLFVGVAVGVALRYGTSTGGMDILAQSLNLKKGIAIGTFCMLLNVVFAIINGLISEAIDITLYTFVYIIISNLVVDKIHTAYNYLRIDVITKKSAEVSASLLDGIKRGCTISSVEGAYTHQMKSDVIMVISSYELYRAKRIIRSVDPEAFIMVQPIKKIIGAFNKHPII